MLETKRQRNQPRITVSQSQESYTESVLWLIGVCLLELAEPSYAQLLQLVIGFTCESPEINFLETTSEDVVGNTLGAYLIQPSWMLRITIDLRQKFT